MNLATVTLACTLALVSASAAATTVAQVDRFSVVRNGTLIFEDNFDAGGPPPSAPNFIGGPATSYVTAGATILGEANGRAYVSTSGAPGLFYTSTLNSNIFLPTNTDSGNTVNGLKRNHTFSVSGLFDLVDPSLARDFYGIRLWDNGGIAGNPPAANNNDLVSLWAGRGTSGAPIVLFSDANPSTAGQTNFSTPLDLLGGDQIELMLRHDAADTDLITGWFRYWNLGAPVTPGFTQLGSANIFDGELYTRAGIHAGEANPTPPPVPLPAAVWMMLGGLGGIFGVARSRNRKN